MSFPYPSWIELMPDGPAKWKARSRFKLQLCLLYAHESGRIRDLARLLGVNESTLKSQIHAKRCLSSPEVRKRIEQTLGPEFVPPVPPLEENGWHYKWY